MISDISCIGEFVKQKDGFFFITNYGININKYGFNFINIVKKYKHCTIVVFRKEKSFKFKLNSNLCEQQHELFNNDIIVAKLNSNGELYNILALER